VKSSGGTFPNPVEHYPLGGICDFSLKDGASGLKRIAHAPGILIEDAWAHSLGQTVNVKPRFPRYHNEAGEQ
jgi:hypothetical protein